MGGQHGGQLGRSHGVEEPLGAEQPLAVHHGGHGEYRRLQVNQGDYHHHGCRELLPAASGRRPERQKQHA